MSYATLFSKLLALRETMPPDAPELASHAAFFKMISEGRDSHYTGKLPLKEEFKAVNMDGPVAFINIELRKEIAEKLDLKLENVATTKLHYGDPIILEVEAGVTYGGKDLAPGVNTFRLLHSSPLAYNKNADEETRMALEEIEWIRYRIKPTVDKIGVFVKIKVLPENKIGCNEEEIRDRKIMCVKAAIEDCCDYYFIECKDSVEDSGVCSGDYSGEYSGPPCDEFW